MATSLTLLVSRGLLSAKANQLMKRSRTVSRPSDSTGLLAPTRLIQEANPEWRLISWALAFEVIALTLSILFFLSSPSSSESPIVPRSRSLVVRSSEGPVVPWSCSLVFPICFFLVAVPWPTLIEGPLIQALTRADASLTIEIMGWIGIPALQHGNVIEVSTGPVGIDEACSGIRSFQASLMIALFLGELYRLTVTRRIGLCFIGFALAFTCNIGRTALLVWVAAEQGLAAIARWHDPAGVTILLACMFGLWGAGVLLRAKRKGQAALGVRSAECRVRNLPEVQLSLCLVVPSSPPPKVF